MMLRLEVHPARLRGHYRQQTPGFCRSRFKYSATAEGSTRRLQTHDFRFLCHLSFSPFTEIFQNWHDALLKSKRA